MQHYSQHRKKEMNDNQQYIYEVLHSDVNGGRGGHAGGLHLTERDAMKEAMSSFDMGGEPTGSVYRITPGPERKSERIFSPYR